MTSSAPAYSLLGSCVTRDAVDLGRDPLPPPVHFFSRTRIQSLVSRPTPLDTAEIRLESAFQRRVIAEDHDKTAARTLPALDHPLVIDLIDERSRLVRSGSGLVTASSYFDRSGLTDRQDYTRAHEDRRLAEDGPFAEACHRLAALLPRQPVVVHEAYWATVDVDGRLLEDGERAETANDWLERAYPLLTAALGDRAAVVRPDPALLLADPRHRWGPAPFHYAVGYYDDLAAQIRARLSTARTLAPR